MKPIFLKLLAMLILLLSAHLFSNAQATRTSVADGNFLNPATWTCNCTPFPWDNIIINSDVILDTNWYITLSFTITPGSSLIENGVRSFAVNSGSFINNGTVDISRFAAWSGSVINNDSMRVNQLLYNAATLENHNKLVDMDSLSNDGTLKNLSGASIAAQLYLNLDSVVNEGMITADAHTNTSTGKSYNTGQLIFTDYTNAGIAYNSASLKFNDFTNASTATFNNSATVTGTRDFWNAGSFSNISTGNFTVDRDFANGDSTAAWALFLNNGFVEVNDDWLNIDSVFGSTGRFCIDDSTSNTGMMAGTFDFCDKTPPASQPFIDFNSGTIRPGITWCAQSCVTGGITETPESGIGFKIFPNPAKEFAETTLTLAKDVSGTIKLFDATGRAVVPDINGGFHAGINSFVIPLYHLPGGIYFCHISFEEGTIQSGIIFKR